MSRHKILGRGLYNLDTGMFSTMAGGKGGGKSGPSFFAGQKELGEELFNSVLPQFLMGGAPLPGTEGTMQRGMQGMTQQFAQRGLTGSGLESRALGEAAVRGMQSQQGAYMDVLKRALTPAGTVSTTGKGGLVCWVAEALCGRDHYKTWNARAYVIQNEEHWFVKLYGKYGQTWAKVVSESKLAREIARPIWEYMASNGSIFKCRKQS